MSDGNEPTVEEILQSIKQVIARDNREQAAAMRQRRENDGLPAPEADIESDVLDLAEEADCLDADEEADAPEQLVSAESESSMRDSLAALAMLAEPGATPQIVRSGQTSVEDLLRELLRPALAEWLDKNLPALVETMVAAEIKRISGRRD